LQSRFLWKIVKIILNLLLKGRGQRYIFKETRILLIITIHSPKTLSLKYPGGAFGRSERLTNIYIYIYIYVCIYICMYMICMVVYILIVMIPFLTSKGLSLSLSLSPHTHIYTYTWRCVIVSLRRNPCHGEDRIWSRVPVHRFG
jgi:hypothetical protein